MDGAFFLYLLYLNSLGVNWHPFGKRMSITADLDKMELPMLDKTTYLK